MPKDLKQKCLVARGYPKTAQEWKKIIMAVGHPNLCKLRVKNHIDVVPRWEDHSKSWIDLKAAKVVKAKTKVEIFT